MFGIRKSVCDGFGLKSDTESTIPKVKSKTVSHDIDHVLHVLGECNIYLKDKSINCRTYATQSLLSFIVK